MKISITSFLASSVAVAMCLAGATAAPARAKAGPVGTRGGARVTARPYLFGVDEAQSSFSACPGGTIVSKVLTSAGKAIPNKVVTLTIKAGGSTLQKAAKTDPSGRAALDFSLTPEQQRQLASTDLSCYVTVENPSIRSGRQVISCPQKIQVCDAPECNDAGEGNVVCQGDMVFESMCEAVATGMQEDDCVPEDDYSPDCEQLAGPVKCPGPDGDLWFESLCVAQSQGYSMDTCEFV